MPTNIRSKLLYWLLKYKYYNIHNYKLSDTFCEAHRLKLYETGVLRKTLGHKREEIGDRRKLVTEKLVDQQYSPNVILLKNNVTECETYLEKFMCIGPCTIVIFEE